MPEIRDKLAALIRFASISGSDMGALLDWLSAELAPYASFCQRLPATDSCNEALLVRIGDGTGGLVLAGHLDVVPVTGQPWSADPFTLREADSRYYGRGVCDMKGFFACALAVIPQLPRLRAPLWFALSCDEEIGCLSAPRLAEALQQHGAGDAYVWVGEPTLLQPVVAHKGITNLRTILHGRAAHSSQVGQGISAIHAAARLVTAIEDSMRALQDEGRLDPHFDVPYSSLGNPPPAARRLCRHPRLHRRRRARPRSGISRPAHRHPHNHRHRCRAARRQQRRLAGATWRAPARHDAAIRRLCQRSRRLPTGGDANPDLRPRQHPPGAPGRRMG